MFTKAVDMFDKLSVKDQRKKIVDELKLMIVVLEKICIENNIKYREIKSKEILTLKDENVSENDYLTALYVYIEYLKEVIGAYFSEKI